MQPVRWQPTQREPDWRRISSCRATRQKRISSNAIRESGGTAISVSDEEMIDSARMLGAAEGLFVAPESAACCAAAGKLAKSGWIQPSDPVVIFNTGGGIKYVECFAGFAQSAKRQRYD